MIWGKNASAARERIEEAFPDAAWDGRYFTEESIDVMGNVSDHGTVTAEGPAGRFIASRDWPEGAAQVVIEAAGIEPPPVVTPKAARCGRCGVVNERGCQAQLSRLKNPRYQWPCKYCRAQNINSADTPMRQIRLAAGKGIDELGLDVQAALKIEVGRRRPSLVEEESIFEALDVTDSEEIKLRRFFAEAGPLKVEGPVLVVPLPGDDGAAVRLLARVWPP
jgi:hypothetical protein